MSDAPRSITKWNVMALLAAVVGAVVTVGVSQAYIHQWSGTGVKFSPAHPNEVMLPAGRSLVYYESKVGVPDVGILRMFGPDGETYFPLRPREEQSYHSYFSGISGRALWELDLPVAGVYSFRTYNGNVLSDGDIPITDRIAFLKSPGTLTEVRAVQTAVQVTGASITLAIVGVLYLIHLRTIKQQRAAQEDSEAEYDALEDDLFVNPIEA